MKNVNILKIFLYVNLMTGLQADKMFHKQTCPFLVYSMVQISESWLVLMFSYNHLEKEELIYPYFDSKYENPFYKNVIPWFQGLFVLSSL